MGRMYLTDEDKKILLFVEEFGAITIHQCQNMFYNRQLKGYNMAQKHLSKLVGYEKLNHYRDTNFNYNIYYVDKTPDYHSVLIMDYYSELIKAKVKIHSFKKEQSWLNKKYFSDAFCVYSIGNKVIFDIVEVIRTKKVEVDKYIDIYNSREAHKLSQDIYTKLGGGKYDLFPHLVCIDDVKHKNNLYINNNIKTIQLDFKLSNVSLLFI